MKGDIITVDLGGCGNNFAIAKMNGQVVKYIPHDMQIEYGLDGKRITMSGHLF